MEPPLLGFKVGAIRVNPEYKKKAKIFGKNTGSVSSQSKVIDIDVSNYNGGNIKISPTSFSITHLINEIKKEVYNVTPPISIVSFSGHHGEADTCSVFNWVTGNPKILASQSLKNFIEIEMNTSMKSTFIDDFLKDCDISGVLQKMKNKRKSTKKERIIIIKYQRLLFYFTVNKECKGIINLADCCILSKNETYFELKTGTHEKYTFTCNSSAECDKWVETINKCKEAIEKITFKVHGHLTGSIAKGRNLISKDLNGMSDPFVYARIERQQIKTTTMYKTLNPTWNESFHFDITKHDGLLNILVWDEDKFKTADFMGEAVIPISILPPNQEVTLWIPLSPRKSKEKVSGDIKINFKYTYTPEDPQNSPLAFFGHSLTSIAERKDIQLTDGLPSFLYQLVEHIEAHSLDEKGIFRESGSSLTIRSLRNQLDLGEKIVCEATGVHNYTGLLKLFFRELPEPLFTYDQYDNLISISRSKFISIQQYVDVFKSLPAVHLKALKLVLPFLSKVAEHSSTNMMNNSNLSIVFGPSLIRPKTESIQTHTEIVDVNNVMKLIFENSQQILKALN